ncbi:CCA tRNA nucleotidyltransferase [Ructibacterium gallinarum]|uniref:tRNA nucleotidyltransferase n=1 Tax=Ructibacterium gallinarum TaxID=2779355 RepID=A0A9D5M299_9FIRM|nr:tRNA nucleotidyltransferase [Ructibacterium gallinarum]MBE5039290.1 tRNA nucleotidyltransferase [Ructibacterium gallinarum]
MKQMQVPSEILNIMEILENAGFQTFAVGGCVRDSLLALTPHDWDLCTSALPEETIQTLHAFPIFPTGLRHGTVTVFLSDRPVEITTFRSDGSYRDHRRPEKVIFLPEITEDLRRRDFTINAMAYSPRRGLLDPFDGQGDLNNKILKCVGDPSIRFEEDALRILRALRFSAVYNLNIESSLSKAIHNKKHLLSAISKERIYRELTKLLTCKTPGQTIAEFMDVLAAALAIPEKPLIKSISAAVFLDALPPVFYIRFAALFQLFDLSQPDIILENLKLDKLTLTKIQNLLQLQKLPLPVSLPEARRMVGCWGIELLYVSLFLHQTQRRFFKTKKFSEESCIKAKLLFDRIQEQNLCCSVKELAITGRDLMAAGIPSGPAIGEKLQQLLDLVINGFIPNEKNVLLHQLFL